MSQSGIDDTHTHTHTHTHTDTHKHTHTHTHTYTHTHTHIQTHTHTHTHTIIHLNGWVGSFTGNTTVITTISSHLYITIQSPSFTPRILHKPIILSVFTTWNRKMSGCEY